VNDPPSIAPDPLAERVNVPLVGLPTLYVAVTIALAPAPSGTLVGLRAVQVTFEPPHDTLYVFGKVPVF